ncbi:hypothetical protein PR048_027628 [Dryococelus australis]|uniref:Uncharacterized protein n=1 Tax=Dryococelus australis TaxID=614101 RepID=A0ABQ9GH14_9NEOP|nr:hypothetical protein PR048_027628 [Dryococelus australis]
MVRGYPPARAAVAEQLACSPPTKAIWVQSLAGSPDFRMWESCRTMPLVGVFVRGSPVSPTLHPGDALYSHQSSSSSLKTTLHARRAGILLPCYSWQLYSARPVAAWNRLITSRRGSCTTSRPQLCTSSPSGLQSQLQVRLGRRVQRSKKSLLTRTVKMHFAELQCVGVKGGVSAMCLTLVCLQPVADRSAATERPGEHRRHPTNIWPAVFSNSSKALSCADLDGSCAFLAPVCTHNENTARQFSALRVGAKLLQARVSRLSLPLPLFPPLKRAKTIQVGGALKPPNIRSCNRASDWAVTARHPPRRTGFNPRPVHSGFSQVGIVPDDAAGRRVLSEISRLPRPLHSGATPHSPHFILIGSQDLDRTVVPSTPQVTRNTSWQGRAAAIHARDVSLLHRPSFVAPPESEIYAVVAYQHPRLLLTASCSREARMGGGIGWCLCARNRTQVLANASSKIYHYTASFGAAYSRESASSLDNLLEYKIKTECLSCAHNIVKTNPIWLDYSPLTKANRVRFPAESLPDFRTWESCRTKPLVGGFSRGSPPALLFQHCFALNLSGSQDLDVKSRPNPFSHLLGRELWRKR